MDEMFSSTRYDLIYTVDDGFLKIGMVSKWLRWVGDLIIIKKNHQRKLRFLWLIDEEKFLVWVYCYIDGESDVGDGDLKLPSFFIFSKITYFR